MKSKIRALLGVDRRDWYRIENSAADTASIHLYNEIGYFGTTADDFKADLAKVTAPRVDLHLNSEGGEVFDGIAIRNALQAHPAHVTVHVDALAASIASVIAMAGDRIVMGRNSMMMIHDASSIEMGNAADMRKMADLLDQCSDNLASAYADRAGGTPESWRAAMQATTWYTAEQAVEAGLADEVAPLKERVVEQVAAVLTAAPITAVLPPTPVSPVHAVEPGEVPSPEPDVTATAAELIRNAFRKVAAQ